VGWWAGRVGQALKQERLPCQCNHVEGVGDLASPTLGGFRAPGSVGSFAS